VLQTTASWAGELHLILLKVNKGEKYALYEDGDHDVSGFSIHIKYGSLKNQNFQLETYVGDKYLQAMLSLLRC